jgi:spermidine synthase
VAPEWRNLFTLTLFASTIFLSSSLIFTVEPMVAKMMLPALGGSPAVWTTCVLFFQVTMLGAYLYAHLLATRLTPARQLYVHLALLGLAASLLPVALNADRVPPTTNTPVFWLLGVLAVTVGLPFFALSATAPLLQQWFARTRHSHARDPYFLYASSNIGSLVALLSYPLILEPSWTLRQQSASWSVAYLAFAGLVCGAALAGRSGQARSETVTSDEVPPGSAAAAWTARGRWLALSAVPSSLMLGVTTYLSSDVAAIPLIWTVPLALYLLSFVLAFGRWPGVPQPLVLRAIPLAVLPVVLMMVAGAGGPLAFSAPLHVLAFFLCALQLHTQLACSRPPVRHLTSFYAWIAAGGVVGGTFNTLIAPRVLNDVAEYPAALVLACALCVWPGSRARVNGRDIAVPLALAAVTAAVGALVVPASADSRVVMLIAAPLAIWCFSCSRRPLRFALAVGLFLVAGQLWPSGAGTVTYAERSYFGMLRVRTDEHGQQHTLWHGTTIHGSQSTEAAHRGTPLTYYHPAGPIGQLFNVDSSRWERAHIGVVGLGVGSLAAYAGAAQRWTFYEIDPAVERIARDRRFFTHLDDCGSRCQVVLGDARLSLSRQPQMHDLLVIDAFSSDAIPVHLLTREAIAIYWNRLSSGGLLAFHISNRHLDLEPVLTAVAAESGVQVIAQMHRVEADDPLQSSSQWLVMARSNDDFGSLASDGRWVRPHARSGLRVWTDDYSNVLSAIVSWGL